ncbi:unnamed protein product [Symbiodinium sp. KB8]|nr:unnamed protein product [Symbiodinium sp. KB8]
MRLLGFLLLAHRALADVAFLAPSAPTARAPSGLIPSVIRDAELPVPPKQAASTGMSTALLLGASAVALALARRRANLSRRVWTYQPIEEKICPGLGKEAASGPLWRQYMNLRRQSKSPYGRKVKYLKQQRILRDHNVWWATYGKWNVWNPNPGIKSNYTGPDSHPDNPDFPAPNSGLQAFGSVSVASLSTRSSFVAGRVPTMGSAKRAVLSASRARSGLVMKAHKKGLKSILSCHILPLSAQSRDQPMSAECTAECEYTVCVAATAEEVARCLSLRREVFVQEHKVPAEAEDDGKDPDALHIMCTENSQLIATGRVLITGHESQVRADLARVAVRADRRGRGLGGRIVQELETLARSKGASLARLRTTTYLEQFYSRMGYLRPSDDVITHLSDEYQLITMEKSLDAESTKAAASTKNQGNTRNPHHWGVKALSGKAVKCRQRLVKQRAMNWYPGNNVKMCKDMSLIALKDGIVQWRGDYRHKEVSVVPWEYVTNKCRWSTSSTLAPQKYEPWMGTNFDRYSDKWPIRQMFEEWKETEEGKAWIAKKEEKKAKQKEIQKKIRCPC